MEKELTILMPCLNEERTITECISLAAEFIKKNEIDAEILVVDNGSTDNSLEAASYMGVRVVVEENQGYGNALKRGINEAKGRYIIMGDSDMSYDFVKLTPFMIKLRGGDDLVIGDRFGGHINKGAMTWSHKYIGNPLLSSLGRYLSGSNINDFNCGLRGFNTEKIKKLNLSTEGMEFATEMIFKSQKAGYRISEVPITLHKDKRNGPSHLNTLRDGFRIINYMFKERGKNHGSKEKTS
ncbi:MAG: glycosyltransferase family 2 protein [Lachnospiraceae bacterium]|nr:glycosyltransferase family 2 protein [Lachnospiraceae bacterium]